MTPEAAKKYAIELIEVHAAVNGSYTANAGIAKAAAVASVVIDLADQLEKAQIELVTLKQERRMDSDVFTAPHLLELVIPAVVNEEDGA